MGVTLCSLAPMRKLCLHWIPGSAAMAPHAALAEIGVDYELARVERDAAGQSPPAYFALNPSGRAPTLEDGDLVLTESAAILLHLADSFPEARLPPPVGERPQPYPWALVMADPGPAAAPRLRLP